MSSRDLSLGEAARLVSGELFNAAPDALICGVETLANADATQVAFLANRKYAKGFSASKAGVVLLSKEDFPDSSRPVIRVQDPYLAFAQLQRHFHPTPVASGQRHASAVIDASAQLANDVDVAAQAVIGANVCIGAGSIIGTGCVIEDGAVLGMNCLLHPRTCIAMGCVLGDRVILQAGAIIGSDGFGYAWTGSEHLKIPQTGRVVLEDDVEIGANTCIDRGAIGDTVIHRGAKLDNLIQIGHNVEFGAYSIMASQSGISGSTTVGKGCQIGGQVGTTGHIHIGDGCKIAAKSGIHTNLEPGGAYAGIPAMPIRVWLKVSALLPRLPGLWSKISALGLK